MEQTAVTDILDHRRMILVNELTMSFYHPPSLLGLLVFETHHRVTRAGLITRIY